MEFSKGDTCSLSQLQLNNSFFAMYLFHLVFFKSIHLKAIVCFFFRLGILKKNRSVVEDMEHQQLPKHRTWIANGTAPQFVWTIVCSFLRLVCLLCSMPQVVFKALTWDRSFSCLSHAQSLLMSAHKSGLFFTSWTGCMYGPVLAVGSFLTNAPTHNDVTDS